MNSYVVGVDGCNSGWIAAKYDRENRKLTYNIHSDFRSLLSAYSGASSIAIDIPIGLSESFQPRRCDVAARRIIRPRSSSVFPAPDRSLLKFENYAAACSYSRIRAKRGISRQGFALFRKIREVDLVIDPGLQSRVFEIHPEVCFWAAAGHKPLDQPKRFPEGYKLRREILANVFPGIDIPERSSAAKWLSGVTPDDVLDATVAAWTAWRNSEGVAERLPELPEIDPRGLRMEMVY